MQSGDSNQQGFSLFELVVGMGITLTIMAIGAALLSSTFNIRGRENRRTEALAAAQHALNIMARDIANAGFGLKRNGIIPQDSDASSIRIRANLNAFAGVASSGTLADADEDVEYFLHKTDADENSTRGVLMRYDVNTQQSRLLVDSVDNVEIYYFDRKVDYTLDPSGGITVTTLNSGGTPVEEVDDQGDTTFIVITLILKLDAVGSPGSPGYQPAGQVQLANDVALRNRNLALF
jgi:Type II secretory pathway, component PulJ